MFYFFVCVFDLSECIAEKVSTYSTRKVTCVIVLLELLTVLLEYIDRFLC